MLRLLVLPFLLALSVSARADAESPSLELWNGLFAGMPKEDVRARHPSSTIILGGNCRAQFKPVFRRRKLQAVRIIQYLDHNDCGREIYAAMMRKYGVPAGQGSAGYLDLSGFGNSYDYYWYSKGRAIKLRLLQSGRFGELSYAPDPGSDRLGIAGKL